MSDQNQPQDDNLNDPTASPPPGGYGPDLIPPPEEALRRHFPHAASVAPGATLTRALPLGFWVQAATVLSPLLMSLLKALTDRLSGSLLRSGAANLTGALPGVFWDAVRTALGAAVAAALKSITDSISTGLGEGGTSAAPTA